MDELKDSGQIRLWNWRTRETVRTIPRPPANQGWFLWSPDAKLLVGVFDAVRVWEAATGELLARLDAERWDCGVAWSPDGRTLAFAAKTNEIHFYDVPSAKVVRTWRASSCASLDWSPDGKRLATGTQDARLLVYDEATGAVLTTIEGHKTSSSLSNREASRGSFSPDGRQFAAVLAEGHKLGIWSTVSGECKRTMPWDGASYGTLTDWSADGRYVAAANCSHGGFAVFDARSGGSVTSPKRTAAIIALPLAPDSRRVAVGTTGKVFIYDGTSGELLATLEESGLSGGMGMAWSPDGEVLACIGQQALRLWDTETGKRTHELKWRCFRSLGAIAFSPDGATLAAADAVGVVGLWDAESGAQIRTCPIHTSPVKSLAWLPDGKTLACGCNDGIRLWNTEPGNPIRTIAGPSPTVFSADARLAAAHSFNVDRIWETSTGNPQLTLVGLHGDHWLAIHPSGHYRSSPGVESLLRYVVLTDAGEQVTLTPEEFSKKYGWKNDPDKVRLAP